MSTWIEDVKRNVPVPQVAGWVGMAKAMRSYGPCPACNATRRSRSDERAPVGLDSKLQGWQCHACGVKGDAVELACYAVLGHTGAQADADGWRRVREWFAERGIDTSSASHPGKGERRAPMRSVGTMVQGILGGSPRDERARSSSSQGRGSAGGSPEGSRGGSDEPAPRAAPGGLYGWEDDLVERCEAALWSDLPEAEQARAYLMGVRKLSEESLRAFRLGLYVDAKGAPRKPEGRPIVVIPLIDPAEEPVSAKFRAVPVVGSCSECSTPAGCRKCRSYRNCKGRPLPLYGSHLMANDFDVPVIMVEGELDVLAAYTYGLKANVVSTTAGAGAFDEAWLDLIEPYALVIGAYDADEKGDEGFSSVADKLGTYRCSRARLPEKDFGDCLMRGIPRERIERVLERAEPMHGISMKKADEYADAIETLINEPERLRGVSTGSARLDRILGGWRPGVVIITGETGQGKTTFATWACLELARQGAGVMLTSFEQEPIGTVQKLLRNQCRGDFTRVSRETRIASLQTLAELPLWVLDHYGHMTPAKLVETIRYARRRHGVTFFLVDHLGFLVDPEAPDERRAIEAIVRALAIEAKQRQVTIFLIAHPHNTGRDAKGRPNEVTSRDLKGASAIRQDADDILIVSQLPMSDKHDYPRSKIVADKIRSDFGISGGVEVLAFDLGSATYADEWSETPAGADKLLVPRERPNRTRPQKAKG